MNTAGQKKETAASPSPHSWVPQAHLGDVHVLHTPILLGSVAQLVHPAGQVRCIERGWAASGGGSGRASLQPARGPANAGSCTSGTMQHRQGTRRPDRGGVGCQASGAWQAHASVHRHADGAINAAPRAAPPQSGGLKRGGAQHTPFSRGVKAEVPEEQGAAGGRVARSARGSSPVVAAPAVVAPAPVPIVVIPVPVRHREKNWVPGRSHGLIWRRRARHPSARAAPHAASERRSPLWQLPGFLHGVYPAHQQILTIYGQRACCQTRLAPRVLRTPTAAEGSAKTASCGDVGAATLDNSTQPETPHGTVGFRCVGSLPVQLLPTERGAPPPLSAD